MKESDYKKFRLHYAINMWEWENEYLEWKDGSDTRKKWNESNIMKKTIKEKVELRMSVKDEIDYDVSPLFQSA